MRLAFSLAAILFVTALAQTAFAGPADGRHSTTVVAFDDDGPGSGGGYGK